MHRAERLIVLVTLLGCAPALAAQEPLRDPGPIWVGITDTASFSARLEPHIAAAEAALEALRAAKGPRTIETTIAPYMTADHEFDQASWRAGFAQNIFSRRDTLRLPPDALEGVPAALLAGYPRDADGTITIEITPVNVVSLMTMAERRSTREAAFRTQFLAGVPANLPVIDSLRALRHELATLLGYPSWAAYTAEAMMAGSPARIRSFLAEVAEAASETANRELAQLVERRRVEEPDATGIELASLMY